jgi:hypothetical protein
MTLLELVGYFRENILHDTGGTGVDWASLEKDNYDSIQLRWTNEELTGYINEAITQVYRRTNPIKDLYQFETEVGVYNYTLPKYIKEVLRAKDSEGKELTEKSMDDLWGFRDYNTYSSSPVHYFTDVEQGQLRLYPIPDKEDVIDLMIYRYSKEPLAWDNYDASPELREEYQIPMLFGAASLAYLKDETNVFDPNRSKEFTILFDREFTFTSAYSTIRKERTANRPIRYGGIGSNRTYSSSRSSARILR